MVTDLLSTYGDSIFPLPELSKKLVFRGALLSLERLDEYKEDIITIKFDTNDLPSVIFNRFNSKSFVRYFSITNEMDDSSEWTVMCYIDSPKIKTLIQMISDKNSLYDKFKRLK